MKQNIFKLCFVLSLTIVLTLSFSVPSWGSAYEYSSAKALAYAKANWDDSGIPKAKRDCVKFVKACVEAGGIPKEAGKTTGYSAKAYMDYLVKNDWVEVNELKCSPYYSDYYGVLESENLGKISPGDIILYKCNNKSCPKPYFHMSIANDTNGNKKGKYPGWWSLYQHNGGLNDTTVCKIAHGACGAAKNTITIYALHFKSKENGFIQYTEKVSGLTAKSAAYNQISLNWNPAKEADGYRVYRATSSAGKFYDQGTTTETTFLNKITTTGKTYYYKVKPYKIVNDKELLGSFSTKASAKTILGKPAVTAKKEAAKVIRLNWDKVDGASGYRIYRKTGSTYKLYKTITKGTTLTYKNSGLKAGTTYYYKVKAYRTSGSTKVYSSYSKIVSAKA